MQRRLTTILIADVAGYSRLMAEDEAGTLAALKECHSGIIEPLLQQFGGRLVKLMGDGLLCEFSSVVDAAHFAIGMQDGVEAKANPALRFRIGINVGDVLVDDGDLYGDGVNVAARLETLAEPGGICVSEMVYQQARGKLAAPFEDLGEHSLKNLPEPVRVFALRPASTAVSAGTTAPPAQEQAQGSIAVFPFDSLSADPEDAYLADGLTSEIINMLSRMPGLRVAARAALFSARTRNEDPWDMVREQTYRYVLTGNLRRAGARIRVIAELTDASTRSQIWSNTFDRQLEDIFTVQEEIAEAIVVAFGGQYMDAEWRRLRADKAENLDAWGLVQKARALNLPVNRNAIPEAFELATRATVADPSYAGAQALLASVHAQRIMSGVSSDQEADRASAVAAAERARELAPDDPGVLRTLGKVLSNCGEHARAISALRRAVEISPFDFQIWGRLGRTLAYGGSTAEQEEGHAILDRILSRAPDHPMVPYWFYFKSVACARQGRFEEAARFAERSTQIQPGYAGAWIALANARGHLGQNSGAREAIESARRANPDLTPEHLLEQIRVASGGDDAHAESALSGLKAAGLL
ncbi:MAG: adenylate/guanylate cyclase domain-containing protein [Pseudomonadota bacterium]